MIVRSIRFLRVASTRALPQVQRLQVPQVPRKARVPPNLRPRPIFCTAGRGERSYFSSNFDPELVESVKKEVERKRQWTDGRRGLFEESDEEKQQKRVTSLAMRLLGIRAYSEQDLRAKLKEKGVESELHIDSALTRVKELGLQSDAVSKLALV